MNTNKLEEKVKELEEALAHEKLKSQKILDSYSEFSDLVYDCRWREIEESIHKTLTDMEIL